MAFLSYRRSDSAVQAHALYVQLKARFGSGQVYMDANSIPSGMQWPTIIQSALSRASVVLALIGPEWLTSADTFGRRRIDAKGDWVRLELAHALRAGTPVIPVVMGSTEIPPRDALPKPLRELFAHQAYRLHDDPGSWMDQVRALSERLLDHGLTDTEIVPDSLPIPSPAKRRAVPLSADGLADALASLPGWEPWEDSLAREYPAARQELRKNYLFTSFAEAVDFMAYVRPLFDELNHHPRWGNDWRLVTVRLTTWDARNRITEWDIEVARQVDAAHRTFVAARR